MAQAGLNTMSVNPIGNPYNPTPSGGLSSLNTNSTDTAALGGLALENNNLGLPSLEPPQNAGPSVLYSPSTNKMFVNGALFDADDSQSALDSVPFVTKARKEAPSGYDWQQVSPQSYNEYIGKITDPGLGQLMARNFEIGGSNLKLLAGRGMQFLGAEETGQEWVNDAVSELYYNQPYQREFTSIEFGDDKSHGAIDWFVANLAQQGPMLIESVVTTLAGAGAGAVAGGGANPFTAVGGGIMAFMGKETFKQSVLAAAKKYMKGQALTNGERKLLREAAGITGAAHIKNPKVFVANPLVPVGLKGNNAAIKTQLDDALLSGAQKAAKGGRNQALVGGGFLGSAGGSYAMGVADIYGEVRDTGVGNRASALLGAFPYTALETLPEFLLAGRILGLPNSALSPTGMASGGIAKRAGKGFAVGGTLEGLTELGQEGILLGFTGQLGDAEVGKRLINSFAAGFAIGAPIGIAANIKRGDPTNLLKEEDSPEPSSALVTIDPENPNPGPLEGEVLGPETSPFLTLPPPPVTKVGSPPDFVSGPEGLSRGTAAYTPVRVNASVIPAVEPGQQGLLNVFGDEPTTAAEIGARMEPTGTNNSVEEALNNTTKTTNTQQLELPLEDPTVSAVNQAAQQSEAQETAIGQQMLRAATIREDVLKQESEQARIEAEQARIEAEQERTRAERQRQFDAALLQRQAGQIKELETARVDQILADNERLAEENAQLKMPTVSATRQPIQPSLPGFAVPSGERLLRVAERSQPVAEIQQPTAAELEQAGQLPLPFDAPVAPTAVNLRRGDAVQERSTEEVDGSQPTGPSEGVQEGDTRGRSVTATVGKADRLRETPVSEIAGPEQITDAPIEGVDGRVTESTNQTQQGGQPNIQEVATVDDTAYASPAEAWADLGKAATGIDIGLEALPPRYQNEFKNLVASGSVTYEQTKAIYDEARGQMDLTPLQELEEAIAFFDEAATDADAFEYAADVIVDSAFFNTDSNFGKKTAGGGPSIRERALAYATETTFSVNQRIAIDNAFVAGANLTENLTGTSRDKTKPWVVFAAQRNLLGAITNDLKNMPTWYVYVQTQPEVTGVPIIEANQDEIETVIIGEDTGANQGAIETDISPSVRRAASERIEQLIDLQLRGVAINQIRRIESSDVRRYNELFTKADPEFRTGRGFKIKDYFNEDGKIKLSDSGGGKLVPTTNDAGASSTSQTNASRLKVAGRTIDQTVDNSSLTNDQLFASFDDSEGSFYRADGSLINNPVPKGTIKLIVAQVLKKLKVKPTVTVVSNVDELRQTNPKLFARAVKSRPDFTTIPAVGFSVGDQIIIFSDYAKTEQTVRFVIAHETLGHFGFRAFMPDSRLNAIFREIYKTNGHIRAVADRKMAAGMGLQESIEEAMADSAAYLDTNVVARFWTVVRNFLNRIGMTFEDDLARYLVSQARRNLRSGGSGTVSGLQLSKNLKRLSQESLYGRFSLEDDQADLGSRLFTMHAMNQKAGQYGSFEGVKNLYNSAMKGDFNPIEGTKFRATSVAGWLGEALEKVQTLDNVATRSEGLSAVFKIFQDQSARVKRLHAKYEGLTAFSHTPNWFKGSEGPTAKELEQAGQLLAYAALYKGKAVSDAMIRAMPDLAVATAADGVGINMAAFEKSVAFGKVTKEEFVKGIPVTLDILENKDNTKPQLYKPDFLITDKIWRIYNEQRAAVNQSALDVLEAILGAALSEKNDALETFKKIAGSEGKSPTDVEIQTLRRVIEEYSNLYKEGAVQEGAGLKYKEESVAKARTFIAAINRAMHNEAKLNDWEAGTDNTADFQGERFQDIIKGLKSLNGLGLQKEQAFAITEAIKNIYFLDVRNANAEFLAKRTIMGAYVPFTRRGKFQIIVKAYDKRGSVVDMDEIYKSSMPYFQSNTRKEAADIQQQVDGTFGDKEFTVLNANGEEVIVKFAAEYSASRQSAPISHAVNLAEFTDVISRLNISITPAERENIVKALTAQGERARRGLERSGVAGWDVDVIRSISEHLETQGHIAGKTFYRYKLNKIMVDNDMWRGNVNKLNRLEEEMLSAEEGGNEAQIKTTRQIYDSYASMYQYSADVGSNKTVNLYGASTTFLGKFKPTRKVKKVKTEGRGERYREEAKRTLAWFTNAVNIDQSTEDMLSGETGSKLKLIAVLFQLGGSVATAFVNTVSMGTHSIPWLATYNPKRGYGGGFGFSAAGAAMARAVNNMKNKDLAHYAYVNEVANGKNKEQLQDKHGINQDEATALFEATAQGVLQAAQFNAMLGTARGGINSNRTASGIKLWMGMFSYTEQLNRRTTYLAAYRLERERQKAAGASDEQAQERAREFGRKAVNTSQGEYAMYNRPDMARGNVAQYIFIYKQFTIISVEMMKGMDYKGRLYFLGLLLLFSGVKGVPFADDLMDLVDTLAQMFGIKMASIEKELAVLTDSLLPGATPFVMRGLLDRVSGSTISTRLGFGDLIPLTGSFKAGADPWREVENFFGPAYNAMQEGLFTTARLVSYGAETIGLKDDTSKFVDILRDSPISALRGVADGFTYLSDGRITNSKGNVISNDVPILTVMGRVLGFYPSVATAQNDLVRISKFSDAYAKSMKLKYTQAYVKAKLSNDIPEANRILRMVNEHNRAHRGTEFEFKNFVGSANRSYNAAKNPTILRYKKYAPKNIRSELDELMQIYGMDPEDLK